MEDNDEKKPRVKVEIEDNGPMKITGSFVLKDLKRNIDEVRGEILLCLCGKTANKPYCDGSHEKK